MIVILWVQLLVISIWVGNTSLQLFVIFDKILWLILILGIHIFPNSCEIFSVHWFVLWFSAVLKGLPKLVTAIRFSFYQLLVTVRGEATCSVAKYNQRELILSQPTSVHVSSSSALAAQLNNNRFVGIKHKFVQWSDSFMSTGQLNKDRFTDKAGSSKVLTSDVNGRTWLFYLWFSNLVNQFTNPGLTILQLFLILDRNL